MGTNQIVVRIAGDPRAIVPEVRQAVARFDSRLAITLLETMDTLMGRTVASERYRALLSSMFGFAALVLASIGVYALLARSVADREREIGIRVALGARPAEVLALVARDGGRLVASGLMIGLPIALGLAHLIDRCCSASSPRRRMSSQRSARFSAELRSSPRCFPRDAPATSIQC